MRLFNPTHRNTEARALDIGPHRVFFSYETPIAYEGPLGRCRVANVWGPTTGRHMNEMGLRDFHEVTPEALDAKLRDIYTGGMVR